MTNHTDLLQMAADTIAAMWDRHAGGRLNIDSASPAFVRRAQLTLAAIRAALAQPAEPVAMDAVLNTLAKVFHSGEEIEGDDGAAMMVDMALWNDGCEALESLLGEGDAETLATPIDGFGGNLDSAFDAPGDMVMVPRHLSVDQLEAFVGRGLCCGTEPITEAVIDAGHRWTRLLGKIAAAPAQPAVPQPTPRTADCLMCGHCAATGERVTSPAKREHEVSAACWCGPDIDYTDPETGVSVYVHKEPQ